MTSMKVLTNEEIEQLWEATDNDQERAMVLTMLECGLRLGELANLRTGDVANGELFLTGKAGTRQVPVSTKVTDMLRDIALDDVIWADTRGEALTVAGVRYRFMKLLKRAGIAGSGLGAHTMRGPSPVTSCATAGASWCWPKSWGSRLR